VHRHSRGIPRLINTICENALMSAYGKQMQSVSPKIIDDLAREFRLDVVRSTEVEGPRAVDEMDLQRAARTLLDLYVSLHKPLAAEEDSLRVATRIRQI
jgi:general secretion pathway protein A